MNKIVFFDIDGTLLDGEKKLPDRTKKAVQLLKENGVYTAIATGRAPFMFADLRRELEIDSFVSFNGQYVVFENEVIYKNPLNLEKFAPFVASTMKRNHPLVFLNEEMMVANKKGSLFVGESLASLKCPYPTYQPSFYEEKEIYQALLCCEDLEDSFYRENFQDFKFIRWHHYSVDVLPAGGSKAEGIKRVMNRLGGSMEDVYAFGDGLNDIEMLEAAGTGIAMGNACDELKHVADFVTTNVEEDGIYKGLQKIGLIE
ncbi:Cof subfamily protein (haloacid dehalogenase superfamily) [Oikeobacillus pervagus]|uniref:Cof subfamily protein (Haloacid dehalogenase superfamily) n=1 Tax=Oikeobacillus pervagus TaxID=1325931 RepID=A0AAJ1T0Z4_9BACI|nr:Cof-type HAD-IIB family hydrolase [Oikeobacillus pervagus]MDQ0214807.1 Cof subfamily protein (haloacid dehalogenase superfamily) [Oikeobacillus pervagus]